jgi:hypothetical protein
MNKIKIKIEKRNDYDNIKREKSFWLIVLQVSVHDQVKPLLLGFW